MIKIEVAPTLVEDLLRHGARGCDVVSNALPEEATLVEARIREVPEPPVLVLFFDDGDMETIRTLNPVFQDYEDRSSDDRMGPDGNHDSSP